jgi:hypothetical protein
METAVIQYINNQFNLQLQDTEFMQAFENYLNHLATNDVSTLYFHLTRIDVFESKLKAMLLQHKTEPIGKILAALIIERVIEKNNYKKNASNLEFDSDEERW